MNTAKPSKPTVVGLIPARAGSTRLKDKNIRRLGAHPLIAYSIAAARASGIFDAVIVSTDSEAYAEIARYYGAEVPFLRPVEIAGATSPDIEWIDLTLRRLAEEGRPFDCFSILRPTSPFRQPETIRRAWQDFSTAEGVDSLRAVEPAKQHPGKMWVVRGNRMTPLMPLQPEGTPWHSRQYQDLPTVHVQNASLEIAWARVVLAGGTIAGDVVMPFLTEGNEGADVNTERDWWYLEHALAERKATLPAVDRPPFGKEDNRNA